MKQANKDRLADPIGARLGVDASASALFDVQVKRFHEYQRVVVFSGKAAPGCGMAKLVIRLIHGVADVVNHDPAIGEWLNVAFGPDYSVSNAERIIRAADVSEQISTAGTHTSVTGNMEPALNGALTIGALDMIASRYCSPDAPNRFQPVVDALMKVDAFMLLADYRSSVSCQDQVDGAYADATDRARRAILDVARMGLFSIDRTTREDAERIWGVRPQRFPDVGQRKE